MDKMITSAALSLLGLVIQLYVLCIVASLFGYSVVIQHTSATARTPNTTVAQTADATTQTTDTKTKETTDGSSFNNSHKTNQTLATSISTPAIISNDIPIQIPKQPIQLDPGIMFNNLASVIKLASLELAAARRACISMDKINKIEDETEREAELERIEKRDKMQVIWDYLMEI